MRKHVYVLLLLWAVMAVNAQQSPQLVRNKHGVAQLMVDGKPYVMLAGELMNSTSSTLESMAPVWQRMKNLNLNTLLLSVSWEQLEPDEGKFDFTIVDGLIREARKYDLKLAFLWFGSWKNGSSGYAPHWVLRDTRRFPRMKNKEGENRPYLSILSEELMKADARAYTALMNRIKEIDRNEQTVIMCQIENEVGLLGDTRDRSAHAESQFRQQVPADLIKHLQKNEKLILPEIIEQWKTHGKKSKGSWEELFGNSCNHLADEMFMSWHYARFINHVAAEGKKAYNIPMFVNAWIIFPHEPIPGLYPSGGPNSRMLDIWQAAAPSIDFLAFDNYAEDYIAQCHLYNRNGNPIFVPEAVGLWMGDKESAPAKAFYTLSEFNGLGFAPFGIDNAIYNENHPVGDAYRVLQNLLPLIVKEHGTGQMKGFMQQKDQNEVVSFKDYDIHINYRYPYQGYGLVIRLSDDEFLVAGNGADISFHSKIKSLPGLSYGTLREGYFNDGQWKTTKYLGGDEAMQGIGGIKLPPVYLYEDAHPNYVSIIRVKLIPTDSGTYGEKNMVD